MNMRKVRFWVNTVLLWLLLVPCFVGIMLDGRC